MKLRLHKAIFMATLFVFNTAIAKTVNGDLNLDHANLDHVTVNGNAKLTDSKFQSLHVHGHLKFSQVGIADTLVVNGSAEGNGLRCRSAKIDGALEVDKFTAEKAHISGAFIGNDTIIHQNMTVDGELDGRHMTVDGQAIVHGKLNLENSDFHTIEVSSDYCLLQNTRATHIIFKHMKSGRVQKLILNGQTIISGDIDFETGSGEVILDQQAVIKGKITGGKIIPR